MTALGVSLLVFACAFGGALAGMWLRTVLPERHLDDGSKDVVRLGMGLVATMTALILGLVTASAKSAFDAQDTAMRTSASTILMLDRALARYGSETKPIREQIRQAVTVAIALTWPHENGPSTARSSAERTAAVEQIEQGILELSPQTETQRWEQSQALALASDVLKTRWASFATAGNVVPTAFLAVLTFWITVLFWSFGLFASRNATVYSVLLLCAISVAASIFLILEMQTPFEGVMMISSEPIRFTLAHLGE